MDGILRTGEGLNSYDVQGYVALSIRENKHEKGLQYKVKVEYILSLLKVS